MTDVIDSDGFRANVGIVLMNRERRVFLGQRTGARGWQFPQGGMRRGEDHEAALLRELKEEIGLDAGHIEIAGATSGWLRYRLPSKYVRRNRRPVCIGQKQRWFLLRLADERTAFRFDHTTEPEFDAWRWADYWDPVREVIGFKRPVYTKALHELGAIAFPDGLPSYPSWWTDVVPPVRAVAVSKQV